MHKNHKITLKGNHNISGPEYHRSRCSDATKRTHIEHFYNVNVSNSSHLLFIPCVLVHVYVIIRCDLRVCHTVKVSRVSPCEDKGVGVLLCLGF